jgi:UDP-glucose 6-dehydrogenase
MKNIAILGYGTVGRATAKFLKDPDRQIVAYDKVLGYADHVNAGAKVNMVKGESYVDAVVVCISLSHPASLDPPSGSYAVRAAQELTKAIIDCEVPLREGAPILVRTTVPPGTCDALQAFFPNSPVMYWPEFAKEASMRQGYEIKAPMLGLSPKVFDDDLGNGHVIAGMLLRNSNLHGELASTQVYQNLQCEFAKLAWNVKRATDIAVFNELTRGAISLGIDPIMAEFLAENSRPAEPTFSTVAFGGKCLNKDLWLWDASVGSTFGVLMRKANAQGPARAFSMALEAHALLGLPCRPVTILGLQDGPSSGATHHAPAMYYVSAPKREHRLVFVDSLRTIRERFWWLLLKSGKTKEVTVTAPDSDAVLNTNIIVIAQKSYGSTIYNSLMTILKTSVEPVKIVVNGCNMPLPQHHVIEAQKWGAVFIDQVELDRMHAEAARKLPQPS